MSRKIFGISGLAELLNCSLPTAQKAKDSGKFACYQIGRKIIFDEDEVMKAITVQPTLKTKKAV